VRGDDERAVLVVLGDRGQSLARTRYTADTGVLQITMSRPESLNAMNYPMVPDFLAVLDEVETCADLRAVILTGAGRAFCAGFDRAGFTGCDLGSSWLLPRIVGTGRAHELVLTARRFDAAEALAIGLITSVVPAESLLDSALAIATSIKQQHPPLSVSLTKKGMWLATETPSLAASLELENRQQALSALTEDQREAVLSFLEKRAPRHANR